MKLLSTLALLFFLAPAASIGAAQEPEGELVDITLVVINDSILTSSMLEAEGRRILLRQPTLDPQEASNMALSLGVRKILFEETFQMLGFDYALLEPQVELRIQQLILEDGSRAGFEENLLRDGYDSIGDFHKDLQNSFIQNTVSGVLGGLVPSPNQGIRTLAHPTPAAIRDAYDAREAYRRTESQLEWAQLQFFNGRDKSPSEERASAIAEGLESGRLSLEQALDSADKVRPNQSIPAGMQAEYVDFLENSEAGSVKQLPTSSGGVAQLMVILGRTEAQDFTFKEAQLSIVRDLTAEARNEAVHQALSELYQGAYVWVNPGIPGLAESLEAVFGAGISSPDAAEL
ncbi:MAG: hypothetical protein ACYTEP_05155 [Planctomycetota bacterium]|jgi:hypothetical protein